MRIIQRNKYRIPAITTSLDTLLKEVSLQDDEEDDDDEEEIEEKKVNPILFLLHLLLNLLLK